MPTESDQPKLNQPKLNQPTQSSQSRLKTFLDFLWDGGYRSTIVFSVVLGAIGITVFSDSICKPMPTQLVRPEPVQPKPIVSAPKPDSAPPAPPKPPTPASDNKGQPVTVIESQVVLAQPNPICGKFFELAFMVVGGYLGLSLPKGTQSSGEDDSANKKVKENLPPIVNNGNEIVVPVAEQPVPSLQAAVAEQPASAPAKPVIQGLEARTAADNPDEQQASRLSRGGGMA